MSREQGFDLGAQRRAFAAVRIEDGLPVVTRGKRGLERGFSGDPVVAPHWSAPSRRR